MNNIARILTVVMLIVSGSATHAQKMQWIFGDFFQLVDQKEVRLVFNFDSMKVGKYASEKEFIEAMKQKQDKKEKGKGEEWEKAWTEKRTSTFTRRFQETFFEYSKMTSDRGQANYTLIFKTTHLDPGFEGEVGKAEAFLDGEMWLVKNSDPSHIISKLAIYKVKGEAIIADATGSVRIADAYAIAGRRYGKYLHKLKKD